MLILNYGVQSHHFLTARRSEPSSLLSLTFRVILFSFGVQSHHLSSILAFRATIPSQLGIQSYHLFSIWCSESLSPCNSAFRAIIASQLRRSESSFSVWHSEISILNYGIQCLHLLQFGIQSCHLFSVAMFRVVLLSSTFRVVLLSFGIQSHHLFSVWRSSHHSFSVWVFRATISSQFGHSEPPSLFSLAFKVTIPSQFGI